MWLMYLHAGRTPTPPQHAISDPVASGSRPHHAPYFAQSSPSRIQSVSLERETERSPDGRARNNHAQKSQRSILEARHPGALADLCETGETENPPNAGIGGLAIQAWCRGLEYLTSSVNAFPG